MKTKEICIFRFSFSCSRGVEIFFFRSKAPTQKISVFSGRPSVLFAKSFLRKQNRQDVILEHQLGQVSTLEISISILIKKLTQKII
jgi:hypothetical protein